MTPRRRLSTPRLRILLAAAIAASTLALVFIGYRAVREWQRAASLVAARRAAAAADLLASALSRDMRGAHASILRSAERDGLVGGPAVDLLHPVASALARYPYAEAFFAWNRNSDEGIAFFSRTDRRPRWLTGTATTAPYPVVTGTDRQVGRLLLERLDHDSAQGRRFSAFAMQLNGAPYQVVAVLTYLDTAREHPNAVLGFLVNLGWAREHYFKDLAEQMAAIESSERSIRFAVVDEMNAAVAGVPPRSSDTVVSASRPFLLAFFDPTGLSLDAPSDLPLVDWAAIATARDDSTLAAAEQGARRTLVLAGVMTLTLGFALMVSVRAARAREALASLRADFVSAVTHELKTPLANLRAINETLVSGRATTDMMREYAQMGIGETTRLTRLVDNLLAYSRITDVADVYSFEAVSVPAVVERSLQGFKAALERESFTLRVIMPDDLPQVRADRHALGLLLNNLIDNAIRYSKDVRTLTITARGGRNVTIEVADGGIGIAADELPRVTRRFFRGRSSTVSGSGLGLAIVERIVADHGGQMHIQSTEGQGTTVSVTLPAAHA